MNQRRSDLAWLGVLLCLVLMAILLCWKANTDVRMSRYYLTSGEIPGLTEEVVVETRGLPEFRDPGYLARTGLPMCIASLAVLSLGGMLWQSSDRWRWISAGVFLLLFAGLVACEAEGDSSFLLPITNVYQIRCPAKEELDGTMSIQFGERTLRGIPRNREVPVQVVWVFVSSRGALWTHWQFHFAGTSRAVGMRELAR